MLTDAATEWLEDRGLDPEFVARYGAESRSPPGVRSGDWLALPYRRGDAIVNVKFRRLDEKDHAQSKGGEKTWWNGDVLADRSLADEPLIITEGEWDALALLQVGFPRVISVPEGAPNKSAEADAPKYSFIDTEALRGITRIILATDGDANGAILMQDLTRILGPARCQWVPWPAECKDANDVLKKRGSGALRKAIESARWMDAPGLKRITDYPPFDPSDRLVWRAPITRDFENRAGFMPGFISITTGIPSHGKSALMNAVTWELARQGVKSGIGSFEAPPNVEYVRDAGTYLLGRKPEGHGPRPAWTTEEHDRVREWIDQNFVFLDPHEQEGGEQVDATLGWFLETAAAAHIRYGARFFLLDPWSDIRQDRDNGQSEHEFIQVALQAVKRFARRFDSHVNIVAHPKKIDADGRGSKRKLRTPTLYDISGSAHWYNMTSLGIVVHRDPGVDQNGDVDPNDTRVRVVIEKSKFHSFQGKPGTCWMQFSPSSGRFASA